jgi:hypothetical protein
MNCHCCGCRALPLIGRRDFLSSCMGCAAVAMTGGTPLARSASAGVPRPNRRPKVRLVFCEVRNDQPIWPNIGYDFAGRRAELLRALNEGCPDVQFLPEIVETKEQTQAVLARDEEVDGYLVYVLGLSWQSNPRTICMSGKPALLVDNLFGGSGEFITQYPAVHGAGKPVDWVSSSRLEDVIESARCFAVLGQEGKSAEDFVAACRAARRNNTHKPDDLTCRDDPIHVTDLDEALKRLRETRILVVGGGWGGDAFRKSTADLLGLTLVPISFPEMSEAYEQADVEEGDAFADRWIKEAKEVVEPDRAEIEKSGRMYIAMKDLMRRHDAHGISVNCLGGFYGGHIGAYPCLGFSQLNSDGFIGGCEADQRSALTMMAGTALFGRPGYISDPVIDTARYQVIYAHCVAMTRVFGPDGPSNPYRIRDHSEDRKGAALQSLMPIGYMTTTIEIDPPTKTMLMHQGRSAENVYNDMACRTKLAVELKGDIEKLVSNWSMGWHRVTFYGDLRDPLLAFADRAGLKVIEEA